jgi:beta-lactamase class A
MVELQRQLEEAVAGYPVEGRYAVAVTDLQTGETIGVNEDRQQLSGCVMNFFILLLSMQHAAGEPANQVSSLIDSTIYTSNATTARALYEIAGDGDTTTGVARVAALLKDLGLTSTVIDHPPGYPEFSLGTSTDNWITARDANRALAALYTGQALQDPHRLDLLERLTHVKTGLNYLTAYGTGGVVSHKNGFFPIAGGGWVDNDIAIVRFNRNGREYAYAVSFFSDYVETKYGDIMLGQRLSRLTWAYFDSKYQGH